METATLHTKTTELEQRLRKLTLRIERVGAELAGAMPESVRGDSPKPIDRCLHDRADNLHVIVTRMEEAVVRIENSVGTKGNAPGEGGTTTDRAYA